jgi:hypothetical protein
VDHECEGSGRELPAEPPPDRATTCPVCGRETKVEPRDTDGDSRFIIESHQQVVKETP